MFSYGKYLSTVACGDQDLSAQKVDEDIHTKFSRKRVIVAESCFKVKEGMYDNTLIFVMTKLCINGRKVSDQTNFDFF